MFNLVNDVNKTNKKLLRSCAKLHKWWIVNFMLGYPLPPLKGTVLYIGLQGPYIQYGRGGQESIDFISGNRIMVVHLLVGDQTWRTDL
jgi:hypothetical protein